MNNFADDPQNETTPQGRGDHEIDWQAISVRNNQRKREETDQFLISSHSLIWKFVELMEDHMAYKFKSYPPGEWAILAVSAVSLYAIGKRFDPRDHGTPFPYERIGVRLKHSPLLDAVFFLLLARGKEPPEPGGATLFHESIGNQRIRLLGFVSDVLEEIDEDPKHFKFGEQPYHPQVIEKIDEAISYIHMLIRIDPEGSFLGWFDLEDRLKDWFAGLWLNGELNHSIGFPRAKFPFLDYRDRFQEDEKLIVSDLLELEEFGSESLVESLMSWGAKWAR